MFPSFPAIQLCTSLLLVLLAASCAQSPGTDVVQTPEALNQKLETAKAGDTIRLANGDWSDAVIHFHAKGLPEKPVVVQAETPGLVIFSGASKLFLSGEHGVFTGVWFKNGHSPEGAVIAFESEDGDSKASYCQVSDCAITSYSLPERLASDHWVEIHGNHNRFDHNYIGNKQNLGTTLIVRLDHPESLENHNQIDHNYFGPRNRMGSNGGETMRVGTSAQSLSSSYTRIEHNYFDRCNGEVEIISIKSSDNLIEGNVFIACEGVLTMRHGNRNQVRNNYFLGKNKPFTGGIRVINAGHNIEGNYMSGLQGHRFHAALPVMNGVPNSPINRYHQVKDVVIRENMFIHCKRVAFGTGSDLERTAVPKNTRFEENVVYTADPEWRIRALDDTSGIHFAQNKINLPTMDRPGFVETDMELYTTEEGLEAIKGMAEPKLPVLLAEAGPSWYKLNSEGNTSAETAASHHVNQDQSQELPSIVSKMKAGDTLWIDGGGSFPLDSPLTLDKDIHIMATSGFPMFEPGKKLKGNGLFEITDGASVHVEGVHFSGRSEKGDASYGIVSIGPMLDHYNLTVNNCRFSDFNESRFCGIYGGESTFADSVIVTNCWFKGFSGHGVVFAAEKDDRGRYNVENITIRNCVFVDVMGMAINVYRGGNDESTLGPFAWVSNCDFINVNNKELGSVVRMLGVQYARINECNFYHSGASGRSIFFEDPKWADVRISHCNLDQAGRIQTFYPYRVDQSSITRNPMSFDETLLADWKVQTAQN